MMGKEKEEKEEEEEKGETMKKEKEKEKKTIGCLTLLFQRRILAAITRLMKPRSPPPVWRKLWAPP